MNIDDLLIDLNGSYATLDLHGLYPEDAEIKIDLFLTEHYKKAEPVKIVYGVGSGVLREACLEFLNKHPMIAKVVEGPGYCLAFFFPKN